jgi:hypothetical protein
VIGKMTSWLISLIEEGMDSKRFVEDGEGLVDLQLLLEYYLKFVKRLIVEVDDYRIESTRTYALFVHGLSLVFLVTTLSVGWLAWYMIFGLLRRRLIQARRSLLFIPLSIVMRNESVLRYLKRTSLQRSRIMQ